MTQRRLLFFVITAIAIVGGSYGLAVVNRAPASLTPASVTIPLENTVPAPGMKTTDELIEFWRGRFERNPQDYISLTYLGEAFIRKGREIGDVSAYERAEATLHQALELAPNYEVALAYLGAVYFVKHDFQGALDLAQRVHAADPRALQALATIGDAQLELGKYAEAETIYRQLLDQIPSPAVYSRLARLAWLQGRPTEALDWMQQAADGAKSVELSGESVAWYQFQVAELYFNTGQIEEAAKNYSAALGSFDNYYLALAGLGKARGAQGQYEEAIELYQRAVAIVPQPEFLAALGDLYAVTGQPDEAQRQYDTVEFIGKLAAINQVVYNRQLAFFYTNHDLKLAEALDLVTQEIAARKDIYGYDALAWALYKNGRYTDAAQAIGQAMNLGARDALFYYHAGMIYEGLGDRERAQTLLTEALSINPHFDLWQARLARSALARLRARGQGKVHALPFRRSA